jgi:large repetitive protein
LKIEAGMVRRLLLVGVVLALCLAWPSGASAVTLSCGDTVTTNTVVDNDIVCSNPDDIGLIIGADNITVQFAQHTLQGPSVAGGGSIGVTDDGIPHTGVTIRGGTISGFDIGIDVQSDKSAVKGMTLNGFGAAGILFIGDDNYMFHNTLSSTGTLAMDVEGKNSYLWGNTVEGGPDDAISVIGENPLIVLNKVDTCNFNGISVASYTVGKVARNEVKGCDAGIVMAGANGKLQTNTVTGNTDGLFVTDPSALVRFNNANQNTGSGIVMGVAGSTLIQNSANDNGDYGIDAVLGTIDGGGNTASGNATGGCVVVVCTPQP